MSSYNNDVLNNVTILDPGEVCDQLLQEFHRFDEELSVKGKWQGGSVTGVCRGWGTSRFMSLEAIYYIRYVDVTIVLQMIYPAQRS